jgi:hypothetical protein
MSSTITALTSGGGLAMAGDTSGQLELKTNNGTTAVTIDTSQKVGINTVAPSAMLSVGTLGVSTSPNINLGGSTTSTQTIEFGRGTTGANPFDGYIQYTQSNNALAFGTNGATERMRINSSGQLLVGTTAPLSSGFTTISYNGTAQNGLIISESAGTSGTAFLGFNSGATNIGSVSRVGTTNAVVYSTTSDQRLKSNIADAEPVLDKLMNVKVRQFDWTEGNLHQDAGFIAQELAPVLSGIVTEGKTEEDVWQLDYSRLTPYLVKALQELNAKVDAQALEIQALKGVA